MIRDIKFAITTDGDGDYDITSTASVNGEVVGIDVTDTDLAATADITVSNTSRPGGTALTILTLTDHTTDNHLPVLHQGVGNTGSGLGASNYVRPYVNGYLRVVVAQGGDTKTGTVVVYVKE